jgi:glutamate racemase
MRLLITDSGVGGLSVCAYAERFLRRHGFSEPVKLTYVNASPENEFGYNSMGSRQEKLDSFDRFLRVITREFSPDLIHIACNTLSVLYSDTPYSRQAPITVRGIVETGVDGILRQLEASSADVVMVFGTPTTIEEQTYPRMLRQRETRETPIVSQACPGLADTISEDRQGSKARAAIDGFVGEAVAKAGGQPASCLCYLACTHYGYRQEMFSRAFHEVGIETALLNPNELVVDDLFGSTTGDAGAGDRNLHVEVEFITRYRIPDTALETISYFLHDISPPTVRAFLNYTHAPGLF